jgi:hypothetical protein
MIAERNPKCFDGGDLSHKNAERQDTSASMFDHFRPRRLWTPVSLREVELITFESL